MAILCEQCARDEMPGAKIGPPIRLLPPVLRFYADLLTWDRAKIKRIKHWETLLSELSDIINTHIRYILSKPLKSETFIQSLTR